MESLIVLLHIGRQYLPVVTPRIIASSLQSLGDNHPWIVVAEDAGILLVSLWITADLTIFRIVAGKRWPVQHNAMLTFQVFLCGVECFAWQLLFLTNLSHGTPALALDEDLAFLVLMRSHLTTIVIVGAKIPLTIPTIGFHGLAHCIHLHLCTLGLFTKSYTLTKFHILTASKHEQTGDHQRFCLRALALVLGGLETLVGVEREAVEVHTVVPVGDR